MIHTGCSKLIEYLRHRSYYTILYFIFTNLTNMHNNLLCCCLSRRCKLSCSGLPLVLKPYFSVWFTFHELCCSYNITNSKCYFVFTHNLKNSRILRTVWRLKCNFKVMNKWETVIWKKIVKDYWVYHFYKLNSKNRY